MRAYCGPKILFPPRLRSEDAIEVGAWSGGKARRGETGRNDKAVFAWHDNTREEERSDGAGEAPFHGGFGLT